MITQNAHDAPSWTGMLGTTLERRFVLDAALPSSPAGPCFTAWDLASDGRVHVRFANPSADPRELARFRHESSLLDRLPHPNLPDLYGRGEHEAMPYVVVEALDGESLADILDRRGRVSIEDMVPLAAQLLAVAGYAHARDVVLRDFHPRNIVLCQRRGRANVVKLASLARAHVSTPSQVELASIDPRYCSPEALKGEALDARSDVYTLAVLFFALITGRCPFEGRDDDAIIRGQLFAHPPRLEMLLPPRHSAPNAFLRVLRRSLEKDPWDRPKDAGGLAEVMFDCFPSKLFVLPPAKSEVDDDDDDDDAKTHLQPVAGAPEPVSKDEVRPHLRVVGGTHSEPAELGTAEPKIDYREWDEKSVASTMALLGFDDVEPPCLSNLRTDALAWLMVSATQGEPASGITSSARAMPVDDAMERLLGPATQPSRAQGFVPGRPVAPSAPSSAEGPLPPATRHPEIAPASSSHLRDARVAPSTTHGRRLAPPTMSRSQVAIIIALAGALAVLLGATTAFLLTGPHRTAPRPLPTWSGGLTRLADLEVRADPRAPETIGYLSVIVPAEATVRVDGQRYEPGPVQAGLSPGTHVITVTSPGHAVWEGEVVTAADEHRVVHPMLSALERVDRSLEQVDAEADASTSKASRAPRKVRKRRSKRHRSRRTKQKATNEPSKQRLLKSGPAKKRRASSDVFLPTH